MSTVNGTTAGEQLDGGVSDDVINGLGGNDVLRAYQGNDFLDGGTGRDTMFGGTGNDTYFVDNVDDAVRENLNEGTDDIIISSVSYSLYTDHGRNVESLYLTGAEDLSASGDERNNSIAGNTGNNLLVGGAGNDILVGHADVEAELGIIPPIPYGAIDGDDTLDGGLGQDHMAGGVGNDLYYFDDIGDKVYEASGEGDDDIVLASAHFAPGAVTSNVGVESIYLLGNANLNATGDGQANYLAGNTGANLLNGGAGNDILSGFVNASEERGAFLPLGYGALDGNDTLDGGTGVDTMAGGVGSDVYYVDDSRDVVREYANEGVDDIIVSSASFAMSEVRGRQVESIYLVGNGNLAATGDSANNQLFGNSGANQLTGGTGNDHLVGFRDVTAARGLANNVAYGSVDGNDTLDGGAGDDTLDGGAGNDIMTGGIGSDYYIVDAVNDIVQESDTLNGGLWDVVESSVSRSLDSTAATAGVEALILTGSAALGRGNALGNNLSGNDFGNQLHGLNGDDMLYGFGGTDYLSGDAGHDVLNGDDGNDTLLGGTGHDQLDGGQGNDSLNGGTGNDAYFMYGDFGVDVVNNATATSAQDIDDIYMMDASYNQLWFSKVGTALEILQVNSSNKVQVQNWFSDATSRVDHIFALSDGKQLNHATVANLVSTMAGFAPQDMSSATAPAALLAARDAAWQTIA
jgi:Ca2+-binding RTX toxin-like protein